MSNNGESSSIPSSVAFALRKTFERTAFPTCGYLALLATPLPGLLVPPAGDGSERVQRGPQLVLSRNPPPPCLSRPGLLQTGRASGQDQQQSAAPERAARGRPAPSPLSDPDPAEAQTEPSRRTRGALPPGAAPLLPAVILRTCAPSGPGAQRVARPLNAPSLPRPSLSLCRGASSEDGALPSGGREARPATEAACPACWLRGDCAGKSWARKGRPGGQPPRASPRPQVKHAFPMGRLRRSPTPGRPGERQEGRRQQQRRSPRPLGSLPPPLSR